MKLITAFIKPFKLDQVREALTGLGVSGMTVTESKGFGRQRCHADHYRDTESRVDFIPKTRLEIAVSDKLADAVALGIAKAANTGKVGDGKILIHTIDRVVRIRTGEKDKAAL